MTNGIAAPSPDSPPSTAAVTAGTPGAGSSGVGPPQPGVANSFVNPQTALSLPVASAAITMTWKIMGVLWEPLGKTSWLPVGLSVVVGVAFYLTSDLQRNTWREKIPFVLAAFFNTVTMAAAVLGLSAAMAPGRSAVMTLGQPARNADPKVILALTRVAVTFFCTT